MRQWVVIACGLLLWGAAAHAVPARGLPVRVKQADGTTITIVVHGDEYRGWTSTVDGYQIVQQEGVYYYYEPQTSRAVTGLKASDPGSRNAGEVWALVGRTTGKIDGGPSANERRMDYAIAAQDPVDRSVSKAASFPTRSLVLVVSFSDVSLRPGNTQSVFYNLLNVGSGSARQYFIDNSKGNYAPTFDVRGPYVLPQPRAFYGKRAGADHDKDPQQMVIDACAAADKAGVDFTLYDQNRDGLVDNVYIIFAGTNQAEGGGDDTIWPHRWTLQGKPDTRFDGVKIWDYACGSELSIHSITQEQALASIGTFCHEFGHVLGLPDVYDTDEGANGHHAGLYHFSVMGTGNYNNEGHTPPYYTSIERWLLGWSSLHELEADEQVTLSPVESQPEGYRISTANPGEFYVIEARGSQGWDGYLGGTGLLVYHVDRSSNKAGGTTAIERWKLNTINCDTSHPCLRVLESGGKIISSLIKPPSYSIIKSEVGKIFYPGSRSVTEFTGKSVGGVDWRGNAVEVELISITNSNGTVSLSTRASQGTGLPLSFQASQRSVVVSIASLLYDKAPQGSSFIFTVKTEGQISLRTEIKNNPGTLTLFHLLPNTSYTGTLWAKLADQQTVALASGDFMTGSLSAPFPALTGLKSKLPVGTTVNLGLTNLASAPTKVTFSVNGAGLEAATYTFGATGRHTVRCTISYSTEDTEVIERMVTIE